MLTEVETFLPTEEDLTAKLHLFRTQVVQRLSETPVPVERDEHWRYTEVDHFVWPEGVEIAPSSVLKSGVEALLGENRLKFVREGHQGATVLMQNGVVVSVQGAKKDALSVTSTIPTEEELATSEYAALQGFAHVTQPVEVRVSGELEHPLLLIHVLDQPVAAPFVRVRASAGAHFTVAECLVSSSNYSGVALPNTRLELESDAQVQYVAWHDLGTEATQMATQTVILHDRAKFGATTVALGGRWARTETDCRSVGIGAKSQLNALYFGDGEQLFDFRTLQDHRAPKTTSDLYFKGAVTGHSRSVYSGLIKVEKGASGTKAYQTNRNLVLSAEAHADSVPNLEIEENDVQCSHASAVGPVDEGQRYYLESRGVPRDAAERLIVLGFFNELGSQLPLASWQDELRKRVSAKLHRVTDGVEVG